MRRLCAWCSAVLDGLGPVGEGDTVSHGICKPCAERVEADARAPRLRQWSEYTGDPLLPPPGAYLGVPFQIYVRWPYVSKSALHDFAACPAKHRARVLGDLPRSESDALALGNAVDPWCERRDGVYQVWTGASRRGKIFDAFAADHAGELILTEAMATAARAMHAALDAHAGACAIREGAVAQLSLVCDDPRTGLRRKGRPDLVNMQRGILADLKTARDVSKHGLAAAASEYNYHWQAHQYKEMIEQLGLGEIRECWIVAVKSTPIHSVACRPFDAETLEIAGVEVREQLARFRDCVISGHWPADYDDETPIRLPRWRRRRAM